MIRAKHIYKTYDNKRHILCNLHLRVKPGDFVFITGPSGAGKTTLFKLLTAMEKPTSGQLEVVGYALNKMPLRHLPFFRRRLGIIFQDFRLLKKHTVWDNVALTLETLGQSKKKIESKVQRLLIELNLENSANLQAEFLSGGEQQRVALARAIIHQPDLIIADEPTGNLDTDSSQDILNLLQRAREQGSTVLMATHDLQRIEKFKYPFRLLHIQEGRLSEFHFKKQKWLKEGEIDDESDGEIDGESDGEIESGSENRSKNAIESENKYQNQKKREHDDDMEAIF